MEKRDRGATPRSHSNPALAKAIGKLAGSANHEILLELTLRNVNRHPQRFFFRESADGREERVGHRVWRMRRDPDAHGVRLQWTESIDLFTELGQRARALRWIGPEHLLIHDPAHAALAHGIEGYARVTGISIGRDAAAQSLHDPVARRIK